MPVVTVVKSFFSMPFRGCASGETRASLSGMLCPSPRRENFGTPFSQRGIQLVDKLRSGENLKPISLHSSLLTASHAPVGKTRAPLLMPLEKKERALLMWFFYQNGSNLSTAL
ncbi:hypothetical protein AVEN_56474-1 [Araneus ventricosus]|uniref:Uncharacterized protein n=1 Tax=Araneus ventricosus TaxID=182803 RepID=A0A4Y2PNG8_ARAVE|nr:hypothetical protein AVEN_56474-1 [Araneus ventricosus]